MGKRQAYRGNPELKQYHLVQDFSGGMDTQSIDEIMLDNEFRLMKNVELADKGMVQNRKGFGEVKNLVTYLENNSIIFPAYDILRAFKVVVNSGNVTKEAKKFVNYSDFETYLSGATYDYDLVFITEVEGVSNSTFSVYSLKMSNDGTTPYVNLKTVASYTGEKGTPKAAMRLNAVTMPDGVYLMTNELSNQFTSIAIYHPDTRTLTIKRGETEVNVYEPTPIEVEELGFNVLHPTPLEAVTDQGFGDYAITGTYLTNSDGAYLDKIPLDGNFVINAFQWGVNMTPGHVKLTIKDQNDNVKKFDIVEASDEGGFFKYEIENLQLNNVTSVTITFVKNTNSVSINNLYNVYQVTGQYVLADGDLWQKTSSAYSIDSWNKKTIEVQLLTLSDAISLPLQAGEFIYVSDVDTYYMVLTSAPSTTFQELTITEEVADIYDLIPVGDQIYEVSGTYYWYKNTDLHSASDFGEMTDFATADVESYTSEFYIGSNLNVDEIVGLDLNGTHATKMQDRLVLYKGNTIYFSEVLQYDYIPHPNFIILPLSSTDYIQNIKYFRGVFIIFTKESIWRISGTIQFTDPDAATWELQKINDFIGCAARNSIASVNNSLIFLAANGLYSLTQNYYQDGLENVKKLDRQVNNLIRVSDDAFGLIYRDQYWLFLPQAQDFDVLKYYYDVEKRGRKEKPFTIDKFIEMPDVIDIRGGQLCSLKNGTFYSYNFGYTDFLPPDALEEEEDDYRYAYYVTTRDEDFGYPTHDKKIKSIILKVVAESVSPLAVTIYCNGKAVIDPNTYTVSVNDYGEVIYEKTATPNLTVYPDSVLGNFVLGKDALGGGLITTHKFVVGEKCKNITIAIEQKSEQKFGIVDIGYIFKLGKVRENR